MGIDVRLGTIIWLSATLLSVGAVLVPSGAAPTAGVTIAAGDATVQGGTCSGPAAATFSLDDPGGSAHLSATGTCGHVHATFPADDCTRDEATIHCHVDAEGAAPFDLVLDEDGTLRVSSNGDDWLEGNLVRVDG